MSIVRGSVDGFEGYCLAGWAIAEPDDHSCVIEIRDEAGNVVAGGRATRSRPDLAVLGFGRSSFAFRIPLRAMDAASFTVLADGVELHGSPVRAGRGNFDGFTDLAGGHLDGWVTERCDDPEPPLIRIVDDAGTVLAEIKGRIDRKSGDPHFMPARFFLPIPDSLVGAGPVRLRTLANGVQVGRPITISLTPEGAIDTLTATRVTGRLAVREDPKRNVPIEVFRDGVRVGVGGTGPAAGARSNGGFDIALDEGPPSDAMHLVSLRVAGTARELFGGPFLTAARAGAVAAARRAARAALAPGLDAGAAAVLQAALAEYIGRTRQGPGLLRLPRPPAPPGGGPRLTVLIPVYRGVEVTRACIASVLAQRDPARDALLLIDDASPESGMAPMLAEHAGLPGVTVLTNAENLGFIGSVNRGLDACPAGDVLLLNSDTRLFAGALDELHAVANAAPGIGTVTALSNNATVFTYPATNEPEETLPDAGWEELAAVALAAHRGQSVEVPTAHGFCMLITRAMRDRVGRFDPAFGRGYGEENDFCQRGADLGFRHLAATGVLVEHRESISFGTEREALLVANLARLAARYPEYDAAIAAHERRDPLRAARWTLHRHRLDKARAAAGRMVLVVGNQLGGGTSRAEREIGEAAGLGGGVVLRLSCPPAGGIELDCANPAFRLRFPPEEAAAPATVFAMLGQCGIDLVLVHHALGFTADFIARLAGFCRTRRSIAYAHDFYAACPRVTMIDALGRYCGGPEPGRCNRCLGMAGAHEAARTAELSAEAHHALFAGLLGAMTHVVAPSQDAVGHLAPVFPAAAMVALPHPHLGRPFPAAARPGSAADIALLGAIGPHKGSAMLLDLARRAWLTHPGLRFHVIGYTDIDAALREIGNVTITGGYRDADLPDLVAESGAGLALFLHVWPETFSYTLTEAAALGLVPVVPDIGAPAERVRAAGFGVIYPFPFDTGTVLATLDGIAAGSVALDAGGGPAGLDTPGAADRIRHLLMPPRPVAAAKDAAPAAADAAPGMPAPRRTRARRQGGTTGPA
jgi:GT2 family glycosyltransferase/glycosyltransferase involved in cell wall biosynthesis